MTEQVQQVIERLREIVAGEFYSMAPLDRATLQQAADLLAQQAQELHKWRTARTHGGCQEELLAQVARATEAESRADSLASKVKELEAELQRVKGQVHG